MSCDTTVTCCFHDGRNISRGHRAPHRVEGKRKYSLSSSHRTHEDIQDIGDADEGFTLAALSIPDECRARPQGRYMEWTVLGQVDLDAFVHSHVTTAVGFEENFRLVRVKRKEADKLPETIKVGFHSWKNWACSFGQGFGRSSFPLLALPRGLSAWCLCRQPDRTRENCIACFDQSKIV